MAGDGPEARGDESATVGLNAAKSSLLLIGNSLKQECGAKHCPAHCKGRHGTANEHNNDQTEVSPAGRKGPTVVASTQLDRCAVGVEQQRGKQGHEHPHALKKP
jgi:hypothetical protein